MPAAGIPICSLARRRAADVGTAVHAHLRLGSQRPRRAGRVAKLLFSAILVLELAACGSNHGSPALQDACAYVNTVDGAFEGTLPGAGFTSYSIVANPSKGNLTLTNPLSGSFTYQPNPNQRGTAPLLEDRFLFQGHRNDGSSNVASFRLVYTPRIMPLGDSITWGGPGQDDDSRFVGYRLPLRDSLFASGYRINYVGTLESGQATALADDPQHEGHGGWEAQHIVNGGGPFGTSGNLREWLDATRPDLVLLHIGTNDFTAGKGDPETEWMDIEDILVEIDNWEAIHWPVTVLLARIINMFPPDGRISRFNDNVFELVVQPRQNDALRWVDQESALTDSSDYLADGLHPSDAGYALMANEWLDTLVNILPKCP